MPSSSLRHKVCLITGGARGIGLEVGKRLARDGAHVVLAGRSLARPSSSKLEGTLLDAARAIHAEGGVCVVHRMDVTTAADVRDTVARVVRQHGGLDVLVNNASAVDVTPRPGQASVDRMHFTNARATQACIDACLPHLVARQGKVLTLSPPMDPSSPASLHRWLQTMPAYALSKYGMTMATLACAHVVDANTLWPRKAVRTAATKMLEAKTGVPYYSRGRSAAYVAEAARDVLLLPAGTTGRMFLDEDVLPHEEDDAPLDAFVDA